jgi:hypothetical protein
MKLNKIKMKERSDNIMLPASFGTELQQPWPYVEM